MRIQNLTRTQQGGMARLSATVTWEDCDRPSREVYFETEERFADYLSCSPHAFLVGAAVPAVRWGERRVTVPEPICPELREGLLTALAWLSRWHAPARLPLQIEAPPGIPALVVRPDRAASFLSGGIDSLTVVRTNRMAFPREHPRSIRDCLFVHGFDIGGRQESGAELEVYQRGLSLLSEIVKDADAALIPIYTNIRHLDSDVDFWIHEFYGAALASVAHAVANRVSVAYVAADLDVSNFVPIADHPVLEPNYSSADLQVRLSGVRLSRLEKVRIVAEWEVARQRLRVCTSNPLGLLNCGRCPKCIRTMMELLAVGKLEGCQAFPLQDVSADLLGTIELTDAYDVSFYAELMEPLRARARQDLVGVIEAKIADYNTRRKWIEERDWKGAVKRMDRRYLHSFLYNAYKTARQTALASRGRVTAGQV